MVLTKQDLKEALKEIAVKADLKGLATKEELRKLATAKDLNELAADVVRIEKKVDGLEERVKNIPTRDEFPALLEKTFQFVTLKAEHNRIKKIIREKLGVEV